MQLLSKAIHYILTNDTDITDTVGSGNVWHSKVPQRTTTGTDTPPPISIYFYTYAVNPTGSTKMGRAETDEHMVRVTIVGSDDEDMYEVARYVRYALDRITPGVYNDIPIDGIEFLNASFDPEGSYELENQSWTLEFKVRVIDNDIRIPPGAPVEFSARTPFALQYRVKVTKTYEDFSAASTTNDIALTVLPAAAMVQLIVTNVVTPFENGDEYDLRIGIEGDAIYYSGFPIDVTVESVEGLDYSTIVRSLTEETTVRAFVESFENLNEATAGEVDIYIYYSILD